MSIIMDDDENPLEVGDGAQLIFKYRERIAELEAENKRVRAWAEEEQRRKGEILGEIDRLKDRIVELEVEIKRYQLREEQANQLFNEVDEEKDKRIAELEIDLAKHVGILLELQGVNQNAERWEAIRKIALDEPQISVGVAVNVVMEAMREGK